MPATSDWFGSSVAVSDNLIVVGALFDDTGATDAGSAYLFDATTGTLLKTFNNPTPTFDEEFGTSVAISGNRVLVGAPFDDTGASDTGSAYLFDATSGALLKTFNNPSPGIDDEFGFSVSISNNLVLIGAAFDDTGAADAGSAYLFDATSGALLKTFNNPTPTFDERYGSSVSISGNLVLVGAPFDDTDASNAGSAYVFDASTGVLLQTFNDPTPAATDWFGFSVSVSGNLVLVGASRDATGALLAGSAYQYQWPAAQLITLGGLEFDIQTAGFGAGQLSQGPQGVFDGWGRLQVNGMDFAPVVSQLTLTHDNRTVVTGVQSLSGINVSREITVPATGSDDFARTIDVFTNPTANDITPSVRLIGNLGTDSATMVFATSDGDTDLETTDVWFGTDDADGTGAPAIVQYVHGPAWLAPSTIVRTDDNVEWTYHFTVPAGETMRLAQYTVVATTRAAAIASANALVSSSGFGGEAAAYLTPDELASLINFLFPSGFVVTNANDSGTGSLRQAILDANAQSPTPATVVFAISGVAPQAIGLTSALPNILEPMTFNVLAGEEIEIGTTSSFTFPQFAMLTKAGGGSLTISGAQDHMAPATLNVNAGRLRLNSDGGANLNVNAGALTTFGSTQHLAMLNIGPGAIATLAPGGEKVIMADGLVIDATAKLDLGDNDLVIHATPETRAAVLADLTSKITTGYGASSPHWQGAGITSSVAAADASHLTALGVLLNANALDQAIYSSFSGETVDNNCVLVKWTYFGDCNLSGIVDGTDVVMVDNGFNFGLSGWSNGDLNYNGEVDGTDYAILDNAFNFQGAPLATHEVPLDVLFGIRLGDPNISNDIAPAASPFSAPSPTAQSIDLRTDSVALISTEAEMRQPVSRNAARQAIDSSDLALGEVDDDLLELLATSSVADLLG